MDSAWMKADKGGGPSLHDYLGSKTSFEEDVKGSIEPGKYADFTITDRDIMTIPERDILSTRIVALM